MHHLARVAALSVAVLLAASAARAQPARNVPLGFDTVPAGATTDGCTPALTGRGPPPVWIVGNDSTAAAGRVLVEMTRDRSDDRMALCVAPNAARNLDVTVRLRLVDGRVDRAGGVAVRVQDAGTYYVVRASALEGNVRLYRVANGVQTQIGTRNITVVPVEWHSLRLRAVADSFQVFFDGARMFEATDRAIDRPGRIGLWTRADSYTFFESLTVIALD